MLIRSLHQTHILLNDCVADLTIPFTSKLSEFIILLLKHKLTKIYEHKWLMRLTIRLFPRPPPPPIQE